MVPCHKTRAPHRSRIIAEASGVKEASLCSIGLAPENGRVLESYMTVTDRLGLYSRAVKEHIQVYMKTESIAGPRIHT